MTDIAMLAQRYHKDVHAADAAAVPGEPEAQLTTPVSNLFTALVEEAGLGRLRLIRESRLGGSRPDFAALHERAGKTHQIGYIELKAPDVVADPSRWTGRNASQWQKMSADAEILLLCNGRSARLYQDAVPIGDAVALPFDDPHAWDAQPLYRDAAAHQPNLAQGLQPALGKRLGIAEPSPEDIAAYVYTLLSATRYQQRFAEALKTPGPRVPITADPTLWAEAVTLGRELLWLHTWAERFSDPKAGRGRRLPRIEGIGWELPITKMPQASADIAYEKNTQRLRIGDGVITGIRPDVWGYSVSGMEVVKKWLGYRTAKGAGRAASSKNPLDKIRPASWPDEWNDELLDLLRMLTRTVELQPLQSDLLDRICDGALVAGSELPKPTALQRKPPK